MIAFVEFPARPRGGVSAQNFPIVRPAAYAPFSGLAGDIPRDEKKVVDHFVGRV